MVLCTFGKFGGNILTNIKNRLIVCMTALRYTGPFRLVPTYRKFEAIKNICTKFFMDTRTVQRYFLDKVNIKL